MGGAADGEVKENGAKLKLVGYNNFVRHNPHSDNFVVHKFHHVEFWTGDATNTAKRFQMGLGMTLMAKSDQSTGNSVFASYVLQSNDLVFTFTAPYSRVLNQPSTNVPLPHYDRQQANDFLACHGLAVRAIGLLVDDAKVAFEMSVKNGGVPVLEPLELRDTKTATPQVISEVKLYGDVVLRWGAVDRGCIGVSRRPCPSWFQRASVVRICLAAGHSSPPQVATLPQILPRTAWGGQSICVFFICCKIAMKPTANRSCFRRVATASNVHAPTPVAVQLIWLRKCRCRQHL